MGSTTTSPSFAEGPDDEDHPSHPPRTRRTRRGTSRHDGRRVPSLAADECHERLVDRRDPVRDTPVTRGLVLPKDLLHSGLDSQERTLPHCESLVDTTGPRSQSSSGPGTLCHPNRGDCFLSRSRSLPFSKRAPVSLDPGLARTSGQKGSVVWAGLGLGSQLTTTPPDSTTLKPTGSFC